MGNRACVVFTNESGSEVSPAVYLHWNGGPESIYAFLDELERRRVGGSLDYTAARFVHVVADLFDCEEAGSMSLGVMNGPGAITPEAMRPFAGMADDNGVYVVTLGKQRRVRRFVEEGEGVRELTAPEVLAEREAAYRHPCHTGEGGQQTLAYTFTSIRPKIARFG
jgi:hypothetical protein